MYILRPDGFVIRDDGATIPPDPANRDFAEYQAWIADGNTATAWQEPASEAWIKCQAKAMAALNDSDVTIIRCTEHGVAVPDAWKAYRTALRGIIGAQSGDPSQALPTKPAYPSGT